jgi:molecular chaperone DnaJ
MAARRDYYEVLDVPRTATPDEIKKAFRRLARKYHPDVNPGDKTAEARFKELNEAYSVLSDRDKRERYDSFGHQDASGAGPGPGSGGFDFSGFGSGGAGFEDLFGDLFGRRRPGGPEPGGDIGVAVRISFTDAYRGVEMPVTVEREAACARCGGSGGEPGSKTAACPRCKGSGQVGTSQGIFRFAQPCPQCGGRGKTAANPCSGCRGSGLAVRKETLAVRIPAGVGGGSRVRVAGKGNAGERGGLAGDLYILIEVASHRFFRREGSDVFLDLPLSFREAALGAKVAIPLPDGGEAMLTVGEGAPCGQRLRLKGKGFPDLRTGARGDLFAVVKVAVPARVGEKERKLIEELDRALPREDVRRW